MKLNTSKTQKINFENRRRGRPPESARVGLSDFPKFYFRSFANRGSSLLETLIYAAILGLVAVFTTGSILAMTRSYASVKMSRDINFSASAAMERMANEIRLANGIDDAGSIFGASHGKLKLYTIDGSGNPSTIEFSLPLNGTDVLVKEGDGVSEALTASTTEVTNLIFNEISSSAISKAVKISLTVKAKSGRMEKTENFYNTVILRESY